MNLEAFRKANDYYSRKIYQNEYLDIANNYPYFLGRFATEAEAKKHVECCGGDNLKYIGTISIEIISNHPIKCYGE